MLKYESLADVIEERSNCSESGITYIGRNVRDIHIPYKKLYDEALKVLHSFQIRGIHPGKEIILQLEDNRDFIKVFWACILGGIIPVPITTGAKDENILKVLKVWKILNRPYLVTTENILAAIQKFVGEQKLYDVNEIFERTLSMDQLDCTDEYGTVQRTSLNDIAFIQFSSGSTGDPKGVTLTHENLLANAYAIIKGSKMGPDDKALNWMPLTHDMGLIGVHISGLIANVNQYLMQTQMFISNPTQWMKKAHEYRATLLYSPNFGYKHFLTFYNPEASIDWDLSSVRVIFNGAEPISVDLCNEFLDKMSNHKLNKNIMLTVYGLAEASVGVAFPPVGERFLVHYLDRRSLNICEKVREIEVGNRYCVSFVDVGYPIDYCHVRVCDENNAVLDDDTIGYIHIRGKNVTKGYYNNAEATNNIMSVDGWLNTGDLGFMRNGRLVITGRAKDIIFVNGQNFYPHDIEKIGEKVEGIELGKTVACSAYNNFTQAEDIIIFVLYRRKLNEFIHIANELKKCISKYIGLEVKDVIPIKRIPKTTSGKIQRYKLVESYIAGEFSSLIAELDAIEKSLNREGGSEGKPRNEIEEKLVTITKEILDVNSVSIYDNLFELSGNSITIMQLLSKISQEFNIDLSINDFITKNTISELATIVCNVLGNTKEVLLKKEPDLINLHKSFPLTEIQLAYLLGRENKFEIGGVSTHVYFEIETNLNILRLNISLQKVINRHPALRTIILPHGEQQVLKSTPDYNIAVEDISAFDEEQQNSYISKERARMSHFIFKANVWPLFEFKAFKLSDNIHCILIGIDALIADGGSIQIIGNELAYFYNNLDKELPNLKFSFRDYVLAYKDIKCSSKYIESKEYWMEKLYNFPPYPRIPLKFDPAEVKSPRFTRKSKVLSQDLLDSIKDIAKNSNITASTLLCAAYAEVLAFWSNQSRFSINLTVYNRLPFHEDVNSIIGDFTSLVILDVDFTGIKSIWDKIECIQQILNSALEHRYYDGVDFIRELAAYNSIETKAVMPIVFTSFIGNKGNTVLDGWLKIGRVKSVITQTPQVFLDCQVSETPEGLLIAWDYVEEMFDKEIIDLMFDQYIKILVSLVGSGEGYELKQCYPNSDIVNKYNQTQENIIPSTLQCMFNEQVKRTPEKTAVVFEKDSISYTELDEKSNQVARCLKERGVGRNDLVGIMAHRCINTIINLMGILKTGAAYVPIDPQYPEERKNYIVTNSNCKMLISHTFYEDNKVLHYSKDCINEVFNPEDIAYIIYTSGSTGIPKGVIITHGAVTNTIIDINRKFEINDNDRIIGLSSMCFDLSVYDIFGSLSTGATLVMVPDQRDITNLIEVLQKQRITIWNSVPAIMDMLVENLDSGFVNESVRLVMLSGDWIQLNLPDAVKTFFTKSKIISLGGATEASIWSIYYPIDEVKKGWKSIPYGIPLSNQKFYVLNYEMELCPAEVCGELYIGGVGLAKGYLNDEEKSIHAFINHPELGKLYKTGDYGVLKREGYIEFLGRRDQQIKIRGYRVELGEIEAALKQFPAVREAIVTVLGQNKSSKQIIAYVVPEKDNNSQLFEIDKSDSSEINKCWDTMVDAGYKQSEQVPQDICPEEYSDFTDKLERLSTAYIYHTVRGLSIFKETGDKCTLDDAVKQKGIRPHYRKLMSQWFMVLEEDGLLRKEADDTYILIRDIPYYETEKLWRDIEKYSIYENWKNALTFLELCSANMLSLLKGEMNPLNLLFPEGDWERAENAYRYNSLATYYNSIIAEIVKSIVNTWPRNKKIRILEFGAGTGGTTASILPILPPERTEYLYTDISSFFTDEAKRKFNNYPFIKYAVMDIDKDPEYQGFHRHSFDIIIGANVLHDAHNINITLGYFKSLLVPSGFLAILELIRNTRWQKVTIGFVDGFSKYEDQRTKDNVPLLSVEQWEAILKNNGFDTFASFPQGGSPLQFFEQSVIVSQGPSEIRKIKQEKLREFLEHKLPDYMVPMSFKELDSIPLTPNGKIDRAALPVPNIQIENEMHYVAPKSKIERELVKIWQEVLGFDQVGITNSFFSLGGDSLKAIRISAKAKKKDIEVSLTDIYSHLTIENIVKNIDNNKKNSKELNLFVEEKLQNLLDDLFQTYSIDKQVNIFDLGLDKQKSQLFHSRIQNEFDYIDIDYNTLFGAATIKEMANYISKMINEAFSSIKTAKNIKHYPVSSEQKRILVLEHLEGIGTSYNVPFAMKINGQIDKKLVKEAFEKIAVRHEILRTTFELEDGKYYQRIHDKPQIDISFIKSTDNDTEKIINDLIHPFKLDKLPLFRVRLIEFKENEYILLIDMHHILTDGSSLNIMINEFSEIYNNKVLPELVTQYKDYSVWQDEFKKSHIIKKQEEYWLSIFKGELPILDLPTDFQRPLQQTFMGGRIKFRLDNELVNKLNRIQDELDVTLYILFLAAYNVLLSKYTAQDDIIIGSPVAGRNNIDIENNIGMFVNTILMRNYPNKEKTVKEFILEVKNNAFRAFENQDYQFEWFVEKLKIQKDISRNLLFDAMLTVQNIGIPKLEICGASCEIYDTFNYTSKTDLGLTVIENNGVFECSFDYCAKLFKEETIKRLEKHFYNILKAIVRNLNARICDICMITEDEERRIIHEFNNTEEVYDGGKSIHQLFHDQVKKTPNSIALLFNDQKVTYMELEERANRLAWLLKNMGVSNDDIIAIMINRSVEMIVSILAVLKTGAAYLPIDPLYPKERISYVINDSKASLLLVDDQFENNIDVSISHIDVTNIDVHGICECDLKYMCFKNNLAYIIYTSGSTGKPKGVAVEHKSVVNFFNGVSKVIDFSEDKTILNLTTISFDIFVLETLLPLTKGMRVVIANENQQNDPKLFCELIEKKNIDIIQLTPSRAQMLLSKSGSYDYLMKLSDILIGGESLPENLLKFIKDRTNARIFNMYGPTETTVWSTIKELTHTNNISIGNPISNTYIYILDDVGTLQPIGIIGEIYISGDGVAKGYQNMPELTIEKFIADPFRPGNRMYKTGDVARWMPDGDIEFVGRIDRQVKIRGNRVELAEIEQNLLNYYLVKEAVVLEKKDKNGNSYLCAYVVCDKRPHISSILEYLSNRLPSYMVPSQIIFIDKLPMTPNSKIDINALFQNGIENDTSMKSSKAKNEFERRLQYIWQDILDVDNVDVDHDFYELGGHSLKAVNIMYEIYKSFNIWIPLKDILRLRTIREMAEFIQFFSKSDYPEVTKIMEKDRYLVSSSQRRMYMVSQIDKNDTSYNMPCIIELTGKIDLKKIESTFIALAERHEILRTSFTIIDGEPIQVIHKNIEFIITHIDVSNDGVYSAVTDFVKPFDLNKAPLIRVGMLSLSPNKHFMLFDIHHIIADGISVEIITHELSELYQGNELPELKFQYKDYAEWQRKILETGSVKKQKEYWLKKLRDYHYTKLATKALITERTRKGKHIKRKLDNDLVIKINKFCSSNKITNFSFLLSLFKLAIHMEVNENDISIAIPVSGRVHAAFESLIGPFINTLIIRTTIDKKMEFKDYLNVVKETVLEAQINQDYPYDELYYELKSRYNYKENSLFSIIFNYLPFSTDSSINLGNAQIKLHSIDEVDTKTDLVFYVMDINGGIELSLLYDSGLFDEYIIERLLDNFIKIIDIVLDDENIQLNDIYTLCNRTLNNQTIADFTEDFESEEFI